MKTIKIIIIIFSAACLISCGKQDEKPKTENQSSTQNLQQNQLQTNSTVDSQVKKMWLGQYAFEESAKNVTGSGAQTWNYVVEVKEADASSLNAFIQVDGFQTMQRLETKVNATADDIEFIFEKYGADNMFEPYKKGDRLFSMKKNSQREIITNWDKLKPNVIDNQLNGKVMFRKIAS